MTIYKSPGLLLDQRPLILKLVSTMFIFLLQLNVFYNLRFCKQFANISLIAVGKAKKSYYCSSILDYAELQT